MFVGRRVENRSQSSPGGTLSRDVGTSLAGTTGDCIGCCRIGSSPLLPQPYPGLVAIREHDSRRLERNPQIPQRSCMRRPGSTLEVGDRSGGDIAGLGKVVLGPAQKSASGPALVARRHHLK